MDRDDVKGRLDSVIWNHVCSSRGCCWTTGGYNLGRSTVHLKSSHRVSSSRSSESVITCCRVDTFTPGVKIRFISEHVIRIINKPIFPFLVLFSSLRSDLCPPGQNLCVDNVLVAADLKSRLWNIWTSDHSPSSLLQTRSENSFLTHMDQKKIESAAQQWRFELFVSHDWIFLKVF